MVLRPLTACLTGIAMLWSTTYALASVTNPSSPITSESILRKNSQLREELEKTLSDDSLAAQFAKLKIDRSEVKMRLAGMTDRELNQLKNGIEREAGGDTVLIGTTTLLLILIIVILVA